MMKRIISCLLVCFLLLGLCPAALAAAGSPTATAAVTANAQGSATVVLTVKAGSGSSHGRVTATMPAGLTLACPGPLHNTICNFRYSRITA